MRQVSFVTYNLFSVRDTENLIKFIKRTFSQNNMITPTDTIKKKIGETVEINLKDGSSFKGKLITADDNLNLSLETQEGIKMFSGKNVSFVSF